jgi:dCMP deaminase
MYVTLSPCYDCSKLIIQSGIKRIVFCEIYRKTDSLELLNQAGIEIIYINLLNPLNQETDGKEYPRVS